MPGSSESFGQIGSQIIDIKMFCSESFSLMLHVLCDKLERSRGFGSTSTG